MLLSEISKPFFIRLVVDNLSPALSQLSKAVLDPLTSKNKKMRCILGYPMFTKIADVQQEFRLPPLVEWISATYSSLPIVSTPPVLLHIVQASLECHWAPILVAHNSDQMLVL